MDDTYNPFRKRKSEIPEWVKQKRALTKMLEDGVSLKTVIKKAKAFGFKEPFLSRLAIKTYLYTQK
jgi:hypothetical protein